MANNVKSEWIRTLTKLDLTMDTTQVLTASDFQDIAKFQIQPKQRVFVGNGRINLGVDDRGTFLADVSTVAPADIPGVFRLIVRDANGISSQFVREDLSSDVNSGVKVGKGGRTGNNDGVGGVTEDEFIVVQYLPNASATMTKADSDIKLPVTVQAL